MQREFHTIRRDDRSVVTTGTFDGLHLGHQAIVHFLVERARKEGGIATLITFDPHPREVLHKVHIPLLTTLEERASLAEHAGIERFVVLPFTNELALLPPESYVRDVLVQKIGFREIVIGHDHRFGHNRAGDQETLRRLGDIHGFTVDVIPSQVKKGITVSSSAIRRALLEAGDAEQAASLLGRSYRLSGTVERGDQRGKQIGFPTANIKPSDSRKLVPANGVYAVGVEMPDGEMRGGMLNIGHRPTFEDGDDRTIEVHIFEMEADLYGEVLAVDFLARLRDEQRFDGPDQLIDQLREDERQARRIVE